MARAATPVSRRLNSAYRGAGFLRHTSLVRFSVCRSRAAARIATTLSKRAVVVDVSKSRSAPTRATKTQPRHYPPVDVATGLLF